MMKSLTRLSAWVILAGILSLAPSAFAQGQNRLQPIQRNAAQTNSSCSNQGGGGGWGWGWDGWGNGGNDGGCTAVPEGGTTLAYLAIVSLFCFGAAVVRSRLQIGVSAAS